MAVSAPAKATSWPCSICCCMKIQTRARSLSCPPWLPSTPTGRATAKFLLVTYHMSDAKTLEERLFTGYVDRVRELHPDTPPPAVYRSDALLVDAHRLREKMGDKEFLENLSAGVTDTGWGALSGWDAASFDYAAAAPHRDAEHSRLVGDLVRTFSPPLVKQRSSSISMMVFRSSASTPRLSATTQLSSSWMKSCSSLHRALQTKQPKKVLNSLSWSKAVRPIGQPRSSAFLPASGLSMSCLEKPTSVNSRPRWKRCWNGGTSVSAP